MASICSNNGNFIFANQSSDEYGVMLADFDSSDISGNDEQFNIITSTTPYIDTWNYHGKIKAEPLKFQITVVKQEGGYFNNYEEREIKKWLGKNDRYWFQVEQDDMSDIYYYALMSFNKKENVARGTAGLVFDVNCDTYHAWSNLNSKLYTTINNTYNAKLNMDVDFDKYSVYPTLQIKALGNGDISIVNSTTSETISITGCVTNEQIVLECENDAVSSTASNIITRWNKNTISLIDGLNNITLIGDFQMTLSYRLPIRVGA